jgi:hypothetical protein
VEPQGIADMESGESVACSRSSKTPEISRSMVSCCALRLVCWQVLLQLGVLGPLGATG